MNKWKFLFLEDSLVDLELIQRQLNRAKIDYYPIHASDSESFSQAILEQKPHLILSDFSLPKYDGFSALKVAKKICPGTPFIFVSGTYGEDAAIQTLTMGATDYVLKDRIEKLLPAVQRALHELEDHELRIKAEKERYELEEQLRQSQKLEAMGMMAGTLAHEINNPLLAISEYAAMIARGDVDPNKSKQLAVKIRDESARISTIMKNLLRFSRDDKGSLHPVDVSEILIKLESITQQIFKMNRIEVGWKNVDPGYTIQCREGQILQILVNLVNNSVDSLNQKFPEYDEGKRILLEVDVVEDQQKKFAEFNVCDFGTGIPFEIQKSVFKTFFTTKAADKGTGLGLSVSLGIANEHGGSLRLESEPGQFTRFTLRIPIFDPSAQ
ncbi:hybrid histidine kinase/response regulator LvrB [Leptospira kmetyi]|uniref:hybrid histidine kinase/response regulator LvrB n=1 Tax=Leptospira kmetyi TaxID=408139 RepID=UPI000288FFEC|nr:ATP-binding protein [Leptospira kmetyi]EQA51717.1 GHKL domain protein [Leptospira kmetyi serovar Malaysia str. Bejo-Iso9]TGK22689.1 hybrid sensor histidine kinase/response regulator [Leptospira kmetyi]TGK27404.1 hybrid sensor histidine kinase/response regulator [Leptospira kmetyi]TGL64822.1 hybrid sensor histidine kinase/response regulator [Leptospira kmetyi]